MRRPCRGHSRARSRRPPPRQARSARRHRGRRRAASQPACRAAEKCPPSYVILAEMHQSTAISHGTCNASSEASHLGACRWWMTGRSTPRCFRVEKRRREAWSRERWAGTWWSHCGYIVVTLWLQCGYGWHLQKHHVVTMWLHCGYNVVTMWLHCGYNVVTLWLRLAPPEAQCGYNVVTMWL